MMKSSLGLGLLQKSLKESELFLLTFRLIEGRVSSSRSLMMMMMIDEDECDDDGAKNDADDDLAQLKASPETTTPACSLS